MQKDGKLLPQTVELLLQEQSSTIRVEDGVVDGCVDSPMEVVEGACDPVIVGVLMEVEDSSANTEVDTVIVPLVDESVVLGIESEAATPDIVDEPRAFTGAGADSVLSAAADEVVAPAVTESDGDMSVVESDNDTSSGTEVEGGEAMAVDLVDDPVATDVIDAEV